MCSFLRFFFFLSRAIFKKSLLNLYILLVLCLGVWPQACEILAF